MIYIIYIQQFEPKELEDKIYNCAKDLEGGIPLCDTGYAEVLDHKHYTNDWRAIVQCGTCTAIQPIDLSITLSVDY